MKTATGRSGPAMDQALVIAPWATMNGPCMMPMSAMQHQTTLAPCFAASGSAISERSNPALLSESTVLAPIFPHSGAAGICVRM